MLPLSPKDIQALTDLARDLVRTPSISGHEESVAQLVADAMHKAGFAEVWIDRMGNVVGRYGAGRGPKLLYDAHMDTIDIGNPSAWTRDPFAGDVEDGVLYGRGAVDMKSALAALIYSVRLLSRNGVRLAGDLYVAAVVQEEPCEGMAIRSLIEEEGLQPDYVLVAEPTNLSVYLGHRGRVELQVETFGRACHAAEPYRGINAISAAARLVFGIELLAPELLTDPYMGPGTLAVTQISSNAGSANSVPDHCALVIDRRLTLGETEARALAEIEQVVRREGIEAAVHTAGYEITSYTGYVCRGRKYFPAWMISAKDPLVRGCMHAAERVRGVRPVLGTWPFSTDGAYTMGTAGIPTVGFGPGEERYAHTADEQVRLDDVLDAARVYAELAVELLSS